MLASFAFVAKKEFTDCLAELVDNGFVLDYGERTFLISEEATTHIEVSIMTRACIGVCACACARVRVRACVRACIDFVVSLCVIVLCLCLVCLRFISLRPWSGWLY